MLVFVFLVLCFCLAESACKIFLCLHGEILRKWTIGVSPLWTPHKRKKHDIMIIRIIMSLYHLSSKVHGRTKESNKTAVSAAAYRNGERYEGIDGHVSNYSRKKVDGNSLIFPSYVENRPDAQSLWQMADRAELKKDGTFKDSSRSAREFEFSLMTELTPGQNKYLARDFARYMSDKYGVACNIAFHHLEGKNPHAHMMYTVRKIEADGTLSEKVRELDRKNVLLDARKKWAELATEHLKRAGFDIVLSEKSFEEQGIEHEPAKHVNADKYHRAKRLGEELPELVERADKMSRRKSADTPMPVEASINDSQGADVYPKYESAIIEDIDAHNMSSHRPFAFEKQQESHYVQANSLDMKNTPEGVSLDIEVNADANSLDMRPPQPDKAHRIERVRSESEKQKAQVSASDSQPKNNFIEHYKMKNLGKVRKSATDDISLLMLRDYIRNKEANLARSKKQIIDYYNRLKVAATETEEKPILFGLFKLQTRKYTEADIQRMRKKYNHMKDDYMKEEKDFLRLKNGSGFMVWGDSLGDIEDNIDALKKFTTEREINMQVNAMMSKSQDVSNPFKAAVRKEVETNISMHYKPSTYTPSSGFNM